MIWNALVEMSLNTRLSLTLMHSLWQAAFLVLAACCLNLFWRKNRIERSYAVNVVALIAILIAMPVTYYLTEVEKQPVKEVVSARPINTPTVAPDQTNFITMADEPFDITPTENQPALTKTGIRIQELLSGANQPLAVIPVSEKPAPWWHQFTPWIITIYAVGVVIMLMRLAVTMIKVNQYVSRAEPIKDGPVVQALHSIATKWSMKITPALVQTKQLAVPTVIGLVKPTILLPTSAMTGLSMDDLEMILMHELSHVRRFDLWVNLLQRLAEIVLFFNPVLWYLSRRISVLREYCCDEMTCQSPTASTAERRINYATALLRVIELSKPALSKPTQAKPALATHPDITSLAVTGRSPSEVRRRIARLLGEPLREPFRISFTSLFALVLLGVAFTIAPPVWNSHAEESEKEIVENFPHPTAKHISYGGLSAFAVKKMGTLEYVFLYVGDFNSSSESGHNPKTKTWHDKVSLKMNDAIVKFNRISNHPEILTINNVPHNLSAGRVFIIDTHSSHPNNLIRINQVRVKLPEIMVGTLGKVFELAHQPESLSTEITEYAGSLPKGSARLLNVSCYSRHDNFRTRFALIRSVPVSQSVDNWKKVKVNDTSNSIDGSWKIDTTLKIDEKLYRVQCNSNDEDMLIINSQSYKLDIDKGRIFEVDQKGEIIQHRYPNYPFMIRTKEDLKKAAIRIHNKKPSIATEPPKKKTYHSSEFSVFAFQTKNDVKFTICYPGFLQTGMSASETSEGHWDHRGGINILKDRKVVRTFSIYYSHREPGIVYFDGKAYYLEKQAFSTKTGLRSGAFFLLTDNKNSEPIQTDRKLPYRNKEDLELIKKYVSKELQETQSQKEKRKGKETVAKPEKKEKVFVLKVVGPDGKSAANAKVGIKVDSSQITINKGEITDSQTYETRLSTNSDGQFSFPERKEPFQIVIAHSAGTASFKSADGPIPKTIELTPFTSKTRPFQLESIIELFTHSGTPTEGPVAENEEDLIHWGSANMLGLRLGARLRRPTGHFEVGEQVKADLFLYNASHETIECICHVPNEYHCWWPEIEDDQGNRNLLNRTMSGSAVVLHWKMPIKLKAGEQLQITGVLAKLMNLPLDKVVTKEELLKNESSLFTIVEFEGLRSSEFSNPSLISRGGKYKVTYRSNLYLKSTPFIQLITSAAPIDIEVVAAKNTKE
jgi:beta-lactamase regulating signal transducer with metallopeptidase domain